MANATHIHAHTHTLPKRMITSKYVSAFSHFFLPFLIQFFLFFLPFRTSHLIGLVCTMNVCVCVCAYWSQIKLYSTWCVFVNTNFNWFMINWIGFLQRSLNTKLPPLSNQWELSQKICYALSLSLFFLPFFTLSVFVCCDAS